LLELLLLLDLRRRQLLLLAFALNFLFDFWPPQSTTRSLRQVLSTKSLNFPTKLLFFGDPFLMY
jgi:hypothetical protein